MVPNDGSLSLSLSSISLTLVRDVIITSRASLKRCIRGHSIITPYLGGYTGLLDIIVLAMEVSDHWLKVRFLNPYVNENHATIELVLEIIGSDTEHR